MKKIELIHEPKVGEELIKLLKKRIELLEKANTYLKAQLTIHSVVWRSEQLFFKKGDLVTYVGKGTMYLKCGKKYTVTKDCNGYFISVRNDNNVIQVTNTAFFAK